MDFVRDARGREAQADAAQQAGDEEVVGKEKLEAEPVAQRIQVLGGPDGRAPGPAGQVERGDADPPISGPDKRSGLAEKQGDEPGRAGGQHQPRSRGRLENPERTKRDEENGGPLSLPLIG